MATIIMTTDSMSKIQSKLNKGGTIIFMPGTYKITRQLIIPSGASINLNGAVLQRKASIQSIFLNKVSASTTGYNGAGNITIINGTFEGMGGYSYDNLLTFFHSHDVSIRNCTFKDILCHGVELNSSLRCEISNCKFLGYNLKSKEDSYKECIQIDHAGYSGLVISGSSKRSKCYDGTCCQDITIEYCEFNKSDYRDYPYACIGEHSQLRDANIKHRNITIFHNYFYCKKNPDLIQACISLTNMDGVSILSNYFDCDRVARIYSKDYSYQTNGIKVTAQDGDGICSDIRIQDNVINGCNSKEAFQQYNKSGLINHSGIVKKNNKYQT